MNNTLKTRIANEFKNTVLGFVRIKRNLDMNHLSDAETEVYLKNTILSTPLEDIEKNGKNYYFKCFKNNALLTINSYTLTVIAAKQITKNRLK
ncbi:MAG TPA: DUF3781 domain-containing protein [Mariprofundaceae bacterium]|nr:DUF3781 domain-containing protein [Mariprofundaceae bacterium]